MTRCPFIKSPFWQELVSKVGENSAYRLFAEFGKRFDEIATVDELIASNLGQTTLKEDSAKILSVIDKQIASLNNQINTLRRGKTVENSSYNQAKINERQKTLRDTLARKESLEYSRSVAALVDGALADLEEMDTFISNKANRNNPQFIARLLQYQNFIQDHAKIALPEFSYGRKVFLEHANEASRLISKITRDINYELETYVKNQVADRTSNKKLIESPEELDKLMQETTDLGLGDTYLEDIHSSKDTLLSNFGKIWREAQQIIFKNTESFNKRFMAAGNKLAKFNGGKADYSFMIDGSNYVTRSSNAYKEEDARIVNLGKDENGIPLEYFKIIDPKNADPKQITHNLKVQAIKTQIREWKSAEIINEETGEVVDGENHRYNEEFKEARNNFEELSYNGKFWAWVIKENVDPEAYAKFRNQYYQEPVSIWVGARDENGPTGAVYLRTISFPKNEFVEVTDKHVNPKYRALQEDKTPVGKARKEFYDLFVNEFENGQLSKIPSAQKRRMIGRLPVVAANNINQFTNKGEGFFKVAARAVREYVTPDAFTSGRVLDAQGFASRDIPLFYTSTLKDQAKIDKLVAERDQLNRTDPDFKSKYEELSNRIGVESKRLEVGALETDLVESMIKFNAMSENYSIVKQLESTALAFKDVIESRTYIKGKNKEKVVGASSNTAKSFNNFLNYIMYEDTTNEATLIATAAQRLQQLTSIKGLALAPFSSANNYILGRIQQKIEAVANRFVSPANYASARMEFTKSYLPNLFKELQVSGEGVYKEHRPYSKFSALVKEFNFISGKHESANLNSWLFALQNGGEYSNQAPFGVAIIKDTIVKDADGKDISLYDAYDYSEATGELTLKKGVKFSQRQQNDLSNLIKERLSYIHGKYSKDENTILQSHWLGKLAMQFHRYIYPNFKSRFKERYHDEASGQELEGRYLTVLAFIKDVKTFGLDFRANFNSQDELGKANLVKSLYELGFFMGSFALYGMFKHLKDSIDEDDENLRAFVGFFESQTKRQASELAAFLSPYEYIKLAKNPLPVIKTVENGLDLISSGIQLPFQLATDSPGAYYTSGIHKNELKFMKNAIDVIPGLRVINQVGNLSQEQDYFK
jgi:hypothetical protein